MLIGCKGMHLVFRKQALFKARNTKGKAWIGYCVERIEMYADSRFGLPTPLKP